MTRATLKVFIALAFILLNITLIEAATPRYSSEIARRIDAYHDACERSGWGLNKRWGIAARSHCIAVYGYQGTINQILGIHHTYAADIWYRYKARLTAKVEGSEIGVYLDYTDDIDSGHNSKNWLNAREVLRARISTVIKQAKQLNQRR